MLVWGFLLEPAMVIASALGNRRIHDRRKVIQFHRAKQFGNYDKAVTLKAVDLTTADDIGGA